MKDLHAATTSHHQPLPAAISPIRNTTPTVEVEIKKKEK